MSFNCSICQKICKSKRGLTRHYNICKLKKETKVIIEDKINEEIQIENKEVIKETEKVITSVIKRWWEYEDDEEEEKLE